MQKNTCLVVDVWEGSLEIDEDLLKKNGVAGIGIRLNDMNGGHHMDTGFIKQWAEAVNFVRFPYFVYNPWVDGKTNYDWLAAHMPAEATSVAVDVEVIRTGYAPATYAGELEKFRLLCAAKWKMIIYTAQWVLPYLSKWPWVDYWWAQYPLPSIYFAGIDTWDELKAALDFTSKPFNYGVIPGILKMWQISGDYFMLPGSLRKLDLNIFYGTEDDLRSYFGGTPAPVPVPVSTTPKLCRIKDDLEAGVEPIGTRPFVRNGLPSTVRLFGGKSFVMLTPEWMTRIATINPGRAYNYFFSAPDVLAKYIGWHNQGDGNRVEQLTFSGNLVEVRKVVGDRAYVKTFCVEDAPPTGAILDNDTRYHLFTTQFDNSLDMSTDGRWPLIVLIANKGEELWMNIRDLDEWEYVDFDAKVTTFILRVRNQPTVKSKVERRLLWGANVTVTGLVTTASGDVWGRVQGGWAALKYEGAYLTSWR